MKPHAKIALSLACALALVTTAAAQTRHDEKPHGASKPAASTGQDRSARQKMPGRHDERPHGPAVKKQDAKGSDKAAPRQ